MIGGQREVSGARGPEAGGNSLRGVKSGGLG